MSKLTIATLNVWNKNFEWEKRLPIIIGELKKINADIIGLQEVLRDGEENTAEKIASELKGQYSTYFYPEVEEAQKTSGVAILTKMNPKVSHNFRYSRYFNDQGDSGNKIFGCLEYDLGGKRKLFVGNTWMALSEAAQIRAAREINYFIKESLSVGENDVVAIMGDMNNISNKPIEVLKNLEIGKLVDGYEQVNGKSDIVTWPTNEEFFIHSWKAKHPGKEIDFEILKRQVDYILVKKSPYVKINTCKIFAENPDSNGIYASDHVGLVCTIEIE